MVDQDAILSRQPSGLIDARRPPRRRRQPPRHRSWGTAIVGLLLASGAGVYTYRQFIEPVPDAEDSAPDAARVAIPGPGFDQIASLRKISEPVEPAVAVAPPSRPEPQEQRERVGRTTLPPSFDEAFHVDRARTVAVLSGTPPPPIPQQPAAEIDGGLQSSALANANPRLLETTVADSDEPSHGLSTELGSEGDEAADTPSLLAPVAGQEDRAQESYARAEAILDADVRPNEITGPDVEPSAMVQIAEAEPSSSEAVSGDGIQIASEAQVPVEPRLADIPEDTAGELPGAAMEIEPSAALAAAAGEKTVDELPEQVPLLAERSTDGEATIGATSAEDEPSFVPARPVPAPMASVGAAEGASSSVEYVQRFPMVVLNGTPLGAITLREFAGDERRVHLGALLSLFRSRMDPVEYERLISAGSADQFLSLEELRRAGLDARYDAGRGRLIIGSLGDPLDE